MFCKVVIERDGEQAEELENPDATPEEEETTSEYFV